MIAVSSGWVVTIAAAAVIGVGGVVASGGRSHDQIAQNTPTASPTSTPTPAPGVANFWVDTTGGTCARQSAAGAYSDPGACATLDAAYQAASAGDSVGIKAGNYANPTINYKASAAAPNVAFGVANGETVTFSGLFNIETADFITLTGPIRVNGRVDFTGNTNLNVDGLTVDYAYPASSTASVLWVGSGGAQSVNTDGVTISNSDFCCNQNQKIADVQNGTSGTIANVIFDNVAFHHLLWTTADHAECMYVAGVQTLTIKRSYFYECASTGNLFFTVQGGGAVPDRVTIQDSVFEQAWGVGPIGSRPGSGTPGIQMNAVAAGYTDYRWLRNTFEGVVGMEGTGGGVIVRGNLGGQVIAMQGGGCLGSATYSRNLNTSKTCGVTDQLNAGAMASNQFVNSAARDWRLAAGAAAIGQGSTTDVGAPDKAGNTRDAAPDAGAYEYVGG